MIGSQGGTPTASHDENPGQPVKEEPSNGDLDLSADDDRRVDR